MFRALLLGLKKEIENYRRIIAINERFRNATRRSPENTSAFLVDPFESTNLDVLPPPDLLPWIIYERSAAFTHLYAIYERYVFDLVKDWLRALPLLFPKYDKLPVPVRAGHRIGAAELLAKIGPENYQHLTEEQVLRGIFDGVSGAQTYELLSEAFLIDKQNLRQATIEKLFNRIGIPNSWSWICKHPTIVRHIADEQGNASTATDELKDFVQYRNEAAHGELDNSISEKDIFRYANFITCVCEALADLATNTAIERKLEIGHARSVGKVVAKFSNNRFGVAMQRIKVSVGDTFYARSESSCHSVHVQSLGYNKTVLTDYLHVGSDKPICLGLDRGISQTAELVKLVSAEAFALADPILMLEKP